MPGNTPSRSLRGETASLSHVPPAWFCTTSTVCSSPTVQVCFALLPILGFAVVSSRRETGLLPAPALPFGAFPPPTATVPVDLPCGMPVDTVGPHHGSRPSLAVPFTANLASSPFTPGTVKRVSPPTSVTLSRGGCSEPRPRGLAPSSDPLRSPPLQDEVARCSLGLG